MSENMPQQLGNYRLLRLIGRGGFADVYLGQHVLLQTQAAIKILQTRLTGVDQQKFYNEALTIARLNHPHIVRVLDFGVERTSNTPYLVTDYAPAGTLRQLYPKGTRVPQAMIVKYVRQVASALQYAHNQHIIHRDVKPENMLVQQNGDIVLTDFGIALVTQSSRYQTTQEIVGTVLYMAPEQLQGKARPASDQYALGIVVYEWLTGNRPFNGSFAEVGSQHMFAPPPPLHKKVPGIAWDVEQVVLKALAKDPLQRFDSITVFANALEQACTDTMRISPSRPTSAPGVPVTANSGYSRTTIATPPSEPPLAHTNQVVPPRKSSGRRFTRRRLLIGAAALVTVAGVGTLLAHVLDPNLFASSHVGADICQFTGQRGQIYIVSWSPDGKSIASGADDRTVTVWDAKTGTGRFSYRGHLAPVYALAWSPNGQFIASGSFDQTVQVWSAATGSQALTYTGHRGSVNAIAWSPDSSTIASVSGDKSVQVWDVRSKSLRFSYTHNGYVRCVAWSPNSQYLVSGGDDNKAQVVNASNGSIVNVYSGHHSIVWGVSWSPDSTQVVSGSADRTAQVWNYDGQTANLTYSHHSDTVTSIDWSTTHIASSSSDMTVQIWDASSGNQLYTYSKHTFGVNTVRWSPNGMDVVSADQDGIARVWQAV